MHVKRKIAAIVGAAAAPVLVVTLPASQASAHGYIDSPPSRQAQCAAGTVECGAIKYEPQSVEGDKGQKSCNGGKEEYAELNDDSKGWKATDVGSSTTFKWKNTARHATTNWEYFVGDKKIADIDGKGAQPGATVSHKVDFGDLKGKQKVLAVWNIADTSNAFYACVDVNIGG